LSNGHLKKERGKLSSFDKYWHRYSEKLQRGSFGSENYREFIIFQI